MFQEYHKQNKYLAPCTTCEGTGKRIVLEYNPETGQDSEVEIKDGCIYCNGTGVGLSDEGVMLKYAIIEMGIFEDIRQLKCRLDKLEGKEGVIEMRSP